MPPVALIDPAAIDTSHVLVDREGIAPAQSPAVRDGSAHRDQLRRRREQAGRRLQGRGADEFWVRGHMPDYPLMPGVLMCEAAAQLCSFSAGISGC